MSGSTGLILKDKNSIIRSLLRYNKFLWADSSMVEQLPFKQLVPSSSLGQLIILQTSSQKSFFPVSLPLSLSS